MSQRRSKLLLLWIGSIAVSVFAVMGGYFIGRLADCQPGQIDGQCGLTTFLYSLSGIAAGIVIFLCMTVYVLITVFKRRRAREYPTSHS